MEITFQIIRSLVEESSIFFQLRYQELSNSGKIIVGHWPMVSSTLVDSRLVSIWTSQVFLLLLFWLVSFWASQVFFFPIGQHLGKSSHLDLAFGQYLSKSSIFSDWSAFEQTSSHLDLAFGHQHRHTRVIACPVARLNPMNSTRPKYISSSIIIVILIKFTESNDDLKFNFRTSIFSTVLLFVFFLLVIWWDRNVCTVAILQWTLRV